MNKLHSFCFHRQVESEKINKKINPKMSGHAFFNGGRLTGK